jgi:hypothetical protein
VRPDSRSRVGEEAGKVEGAWMCHLPLRHQHPLPVAPCTMVEGKAIKVRWVARRPRVGDMVEGPDLLEEGSVVLRGGVERGGGWRRGV